MASSLSDSWLFYCGGDAAAHGGQVRVDGTTANLGHMGAPHGTSNVDVGNPRTPKLLSRLPIREGAHSHKVRPHDGLMLVNLERVGGPSDAAFPHPRQSLVTTSGRPSNSKMRFRRWVDHTVHLQRPADILVDGVVQQGHRHGRINLTTGCFELQGTDQIKALIVDHCARLGDRHRVDAVGK